MPLIEKVQLGLDIASCCPVIGSVTSIISGGISVARGNYAAAALDFACVVPGVGFIKAGVKAERLAKLGEAAVKALKVEKALNKVAKIAEVTGEVLGKGKTLALKVVEKIPKIHVEEVYVGGLRTAEGVEVGGFRYFAVRAGEKEGGKVAEGASKAADRQAAVRQAWKQEKELVQETGRGTRPWTRQEKKELLENGKVKGYEGHHINNVKDHVELARNPENIKFVKGRTEHLEEHGGNFKNETSGELIKRRDGG